MSPVARRSSGASIFLLAAMLPAPLALPRTASAQAADVKPTADVVDADFLPRRWAQTDMASLTAALRQYQSAHGSLPTGDVLGSLCPQYLAPCPRQDPWGTAYRFALEGSKPGVACAGPDKAFGTKDDLTLGLSEAPSLPAGTKEVPAPSEAMPTAAAPAAASSASGSGTSANWNVATAYLQLARLADGLESYRLEKGYYPVVSETAALEHVLVPAHLAGGDWSATDPWGHAYRYHVTDDGRSYTLVSAGADGQFESLVPLVAGPVTSPDADLVISDNSFLRWPAGVSGAAGPKASEPAASVPRGLAHRETAVEPPAAPSGDKAEHAREQLRALAAELSAWRGKHGSYPEFDDAARAVEAMGSKAGATDPWGQALAYLTLASGGRYVLASAGPNGKLDGSLEEYASGSHPAGDDLVVQNGKLAE